MDLRDYFEQGFMFAWGVAAFLGLCYLLDLALKAGMGGN